MIYIFIDEAGSRMLTGAYASGLVLNMVYLLRITAARSEGPNRLTRLLFLWMDVKEAELKRRSGVS